MQQQNLISGKVNVEEMPEVNIFQGINGGFLLYSNDMTTNVVLYNYVVLSLRVFGLLLSSLLLFPHFGGHISRNIVEITIKMKTIVQKPLMIKIIKLRLRNSNS